jgi:hypothetical protein
VSGSARIRARNVNPSVESLEARALLSAGVLEPPHPVSQSIVKAAHVPKILINSGAEQAIIRALSGGMGHEWTALLLREKPSIRVEPVGGASLEFTARGLVAEDPPYLLSGYTGVFHDRVAIQAAGALVLKRNQIELGAIMRGPFTNADGTDYVVFGINRGAGATLPPILPSAPWITADALVTITVGPNGSTYSGTLTDRITGVTQTIDPADIQVVASVVRVLLQPSQLPSEGLPLSRYHFAVWTEDQLDLATGDLASIAPRNEMLPIGVETNMSPTMR